MKKIQKAIVYLKMTFVFFLMTGCSQETNNNCSAFKKKYPDALRAVSGKADTTFLIRTLTDIITNDSFCIDPYLTRGDLFWYLDSTEQAKADYLKAISLSRNNVYAQYRMGLVYYYDDKFDSAIYYFQQAIDNKTHNGAVVDYPGYRERIGSDENKYDIPYVEIIYKQGISYYYKGAFKEARQNFSFCIERYYMLSDSYLYRGAILLEINDKKSACQDFENAKKNGNKLANEYLEKYCSQE